MNEALKKLAENQSKITAEIMKMKVDLMDLEKMRKDLRGLKSLIPEDKLDGFELAREDEVNVITPFAILYPSFLLAPSPTACPPYKDISPRKINNNSSIPLII